MTRPARLGLETLDRRDLPSVVWSDFALVVTADSSDDTVTVTRDTRGTTSVFDDRLTVRREWTPTGNLFFEEESLTYPMFWGTTPIVTSVKATLGNGANKFTNSTSMPSEVSGGSQTDKFYGGSGQDKFYGKGGTDYLYGYGGNDRLYGGDGTDFLYGGDHTDGLYGGYGFDQLDGNGGSDRFLLTESPDVILGYDSTKDTKVTFANTYDETEGSSEYWTAKNWTQTEVEWVDDALAAVHEVANTRMFLRYDGEDLTFQRVGVEWFDPNGPWRSGHVLGWNDNDGTITLADYSFSSKTRAHEVTLHELGHNWDQESILWAQFLSLSGWTNSPTTQQIIGLADGTYRVSGDGEWLYKGSQQEFTRTYARENPMEDFAECFAMHFLHEMGEESTMSGARDYDDMDGKMAFMATFVDVYT